MSNEEAAVADETEALRAEVAELRSEVERMRAWQAGHVCAPVVSQCTCGSTALPTTCPVHTRPWTGYVSPQNVCGGAAPIGQTIMILPGDEPLNFFQPTAGCAPAPVPNMVFFNTANCG